MAAPAASNVRDVGNNVDTLVKDVKSTISKEGLARVAFPQLRRSAISPILRDPEYFPNFWSRSVFATLVLEPRREDCSALINMSAAQLLNPKAESRASHVSESDSAL